MEVETPRARGRRKFTVGALEQAAHILGALAASVLAVGLIGPYIAAFTGSARIPRAVLMGVAVSAIAFALCSAVASMTLRGLSRRADDDEVLGSGWNDGRRRGTEP